MLLERVATRKRAGSWRCLLLKRIATGDDAPDGAADVVDMVKFCNNRLQRNSSGNRHHRRDETSAGPGIHAGGKFKGKRQDRESIDPKKTGR